MSHHHEKCGIASNGPCLQHEHKKQSPLLLLSLSLTGAGPINAADGCRGVNSLVSTTISIQWQSKEIKMHEIIKTQDIRSIQKPKKNILSLFHFSAFTIWRHKTWAGAWWRNYLIYLTFPSSVSPVLTFRKSRVLISQNISRYIFLIPTQHPLSWKLSRTYTF